MFAVIVCYKVAVRNYLGQPSAGFFFSSDFFIASFQSPSILSKSGLGPGDVCFFFGCGLGLFILP